MNLIILKNGESIVARTEDEKAEGDVYTIKEFETIPDYPETEPGVGKEWVLVYVSKTDSLTWELHDRELTIPEKLAKLDDAVAALELLGVE